MWHLLSTSGAATLLKLLLSQHHLCLLQPLLPTSKALAKVSVPCGFHHVAFTTSHHSAFLDGSQNSQIHSYQPFFLSSLLFPCHFPLPIQYQETFHGSLMFSFIPPMPDGFVFSPMLAGSNQSTEVHPGSPEKLLLKILLRQQ